MSHESVRTVAVNFFRNNSRIFPSANYLALETGESVPFCQGVLDTITGAGKKTSPVQKLLEPKKEEIGMKIPARFIRTGFLICAFLALPRTFEFIREWLERSGPHFLNSVTALVFVVALFLGFQAFVMIKHWARWGLLSFTFLLLLFSVFCTVDGVYSTRSSKINPEIAQNAQKSSLILIDLENKKIRIEKENAKIQGVLDKIEDSALSFWNKDYQKKQVGKIQDLTQIENLIIETKKGTVTGSRPEILRGDFEILVLVIFSILLDLIGPMALAVALFLPGGKK